MGCCGGRAKLMTGIITMIYGGESQVFSGFWGMSGAPSERSKGLALGYDAGAPYVVVGGSTGNSSFGNITFRVSSGRATVWTRDVGTAGFFESVWPRAIALDTGYNTLVSIAHTDATDSNQQKCLTVKLGTDGTVTWQRSLRHDTAGVAIVPSCITTDSNDNVYVAGNRQADAFVVKYNSSGTLQWLKTLYSDNTARIDCITTDGAGNVVVAGVYQFSGADAYVHITKYDSAGAIQWQKYISDLGGTFDSSFGVPAIACDGSSNVYFYFSSSLGGPNYYDYYIKLNSSGAMQWTRRIDGAGSGQSATGAAYVDTDGYIYFCSLGASGGQYIVKYDSSGTRQFDKSFSGILGSCGIVVDDQGFMWTLGYATGDLSGADYYSLTRVPSDGLANYSFTIPTEGDTIASSTPNATENTTALTVGTSSLIGANGSNYTDTAGALTTSTPSLDSYVSTG